MPETPSIVTLGTSASQKTHAAGESGVPLSPAGSKPLTAEQARSLKAAALRELAKRAHNGCWNHPPLWLAIALFSGLQHTQAAFVWVNAAWFLLIAITRLLLQNRMHTLVVKRPQFAERAFLTLMFCNSLHWGVLAAASLVWPALAVIQTPLLMALTAIAASTTIGLAILPIVRVGLPVVILGPIACVLLADFEPQRAFMSFGVLMFGAFLFKASKVVHADYWAAAHANVELEERARQLEQLSNTDALTQVPNRHSFDLRLVAEWSRAARDRTPLSILMIDIDHFKKINDTYGHPFGDRCLKAVAGALQSNLRRPTDGLVRYGGEEFAVLLPNTPTATATHMAQRLRQGVAELRIDHETGDVQVFCSIGVHTVLPDPGTHSSGALDKADQALYAAKNSGRNCVVVSPQSWG